MIASSAGDAGKVPAAAHLGKHQAAGERGHLNAPRLGGLRDLDPAAERPWYRRIPPVSSVIVVILAALFSGWLVSSDGGSKAFVDHSYPPGATARLIDLDVQVTGITTAQAVDGAATSGLFLIVQITATNSGLEQQGIAGVEFITPDGKTVYAAGAESVSGVEPGFQSKTFVPIVVDPNRLSGLRLRLDDAGMYTLREPRLVMDLGIDDKGAQQLRDAGTGRAVELPDPEVIGVP